MAFSFYKERKQVVKFVENGKEGTGDMKRTHEGPLFPNLQLMFKNNQHKPFEISEVMISAKPSEEKVNSTVAEKDIDMEANEYIKRKHHSLYLQKLMSMNAAPA